MLEPVSCTACCMLWALAGSTRPVVYGLMCFTKGDILRQCDAVGSAGNSFIPLEFGEVLLSLHALPCLRSYPVGRGTLLEVLLAFIKNCIDNSSWNCGVIVVFLSLESGAVFSLARYTNRRLSRNHLPISPRRLPPH